MTDLTEQQKDRRILWLELALSCALPELEAAGCEANKVARMIRLAVDSPRYPPPRRGLTLVVDNGDAA